jgi:hypothetical protein
MKAIKAKKPVALAVTLILIGAFLLLAKIGIHPVNWIGVLVSWALPLVLIVAGYAVLRRGSLVGWIIGAFGVVALIAKLGSLVMIIIAAALILYGGSLLFSRRNRS